MEKKVVGAWIIHHINKLMSVSAGAADFDQIYFSAKCGSLLSASASTEACAMTNDRLYAIARASNAQ